MVEVRAQRASKPVSVAAVDLGASSGRVMLGEVGPDHLRLTAAARFANGPVPADDGLHWDVSALHRHALDGLRAAAAQAPGGLVSVGIDSWAVDYGLLRGGRLLAEPFHYRDEHRNEVGPRRVHAQVPPAELYARTGLQFLPFNTVYQLAADTRLAEADRLLLVPDLLAHWLTGAEVAERTNASTTGLLSVTTGQWDDELIASLGLPRGLFADLVDPGTTIGTLLPEVGEAVGAPGLPVVAVGSHDTASAVRRRPDDRRRLGLHLPRHLGPRRPRAGRAGADRGGPRRQLHPRGRRRRHHPLPHQRDGHLAAQRDPADVGSRRPRRAARGRRRRHRSCPGLRRPGPALRRSRRHAGTDRGLVRRARRTRAGRRRVAWCDRIVESLAAAYALALATAAELSGRTVRQVHVVGGGSQNALLCQALADRTGLPVVAGPVEATALGNVLVQGRAAGAVHGTLDDLRALVVRTQDLRRHEPRVRAWKDAEL